MGRERARIERLELGRVEAAADPALAFRPQRQAVQITALQVAKAGQTVRFTLKTPENEVIAVRPQ